jgi:hypothetical protein
MSVTQSDLDAFQQFAAERIARKGAESLDELLREWELARERRDTIESVKRGLADVDGGRTRPADSLLDELRGGRASQ